MMLETKGSWQGNTLQDLHFNATKSPWVLNSGYKITSQIESHFQINIRLASETDPFATMRHIDWDRFENTGTGINLIGTTTGEFIIMVDSSGCEWWVKVGVEP
jgi:hypothetical protein